jgi:hypothetical protein
MSNRVEEKSSFDYERLRDAKIKSCVRFQNDRTFFAKTEWIE